MAAGRRSLTPNSVTADLRAAGKTSSPAKDDSQITHRKRASSISARPSRHWWQDFSQWSWIEMRRYFLEEYRVGSLAEYRSGFDTSRFYRPDPLTILLYGPSGSGKSSLINSILRVVDNSSDWNPSQPMHNEDPGRVSCTPHTTDVIIGALRDPALGRVELWDTKGIWSHTEPYADIENCIEYCFGEVAIGSLPKHEGITEHEPSPSHLRKLRPYGERRAKAVDLIVFVVDPSINKDIKHMQELARRLLRFNIPYCVVLTKADAFVNRWSNLVENFKVHINNVPADRTMCVENYKADRSRRSGEVDRNLLYIFFKFLTFAEESLLISKSPDNVTNSGALGPVERKKDFVPTLIGLSAVLFVLSTILAYLVFQNSINQQRRY